MKTQRMWCMVSVMFLLLSSAAVAGAADFAWIKDFNVWAEGDPTDFRTRMATRFKIGDAQIDAIYSNVQKAADTYMIFRLGEMSARPPDYVLERYKTSKGKGWGVLAKSLGIKPGSKEFHALKRGSDIYDAKGKGKDKGKGKSKGKGKGKDKD